jgi:hypothetical protein
MIDCIHLGADGACRHISEAVGLPIVVAPSACQFCIKTKPDPETRHESYPVLNLAWQERNARGMEVGPIPTFTPPPTTATARREYKTRQGIADQMLAVARTVPKRALAPIISNPEDRLDVCEECPAGKWKRGKCTAGCNCRNRPRPLANVGPDCPLRFWRRR